MDTLFVEPLQVTGHILGAQSIDMFCRARMPAYWAGKSVGETDCLRRGREGSSG